ncbi:hypothetical protein [Tepidibacter formicigenes]|jgi:hypothetical protein|uniref:AP2 domain-containing protein n=1 Tax=Tepidibacter formicigenes DSM 15518 TaxID=1123349 RepID=A0A1M6LSU0_9FIRM|nr:hypothetical protein [Tepidibacter formicigenes]SHJ74243.1 hypothetical protein SAMN02744037_00719 [Tepidibacter formicigenes DSM 15518]
MAKLIDLTGQRFGKLVVIKRGKNDKTNHARWYCQCDCGEVVLVTRGNLRNGRAKSCGCLRREKITRYNIKKDNTGESKTKLYQIWIAMRQRVKNPNSQAFKNYGGRGITICKEWEEDFQVFKKWSISNGYKENLSIDRIDNDKGYSPENCRWTDWETQCNNTRNNINITYNGETKTITEWEKTLGFKRNVLLNRIYKYDWSVEKAFTTPVKKQKSHNGK